MAPVAVGTQCTLRMDWRFTNHVLPVEGDFLRSAAGSCYRIDRVRPSPRDARIVSYRVTRLGKDAVAAEDAGVYEFRWFPRRARRG